MQLERTHVGDEVFVTEDLVYSAEQRLGPSGSVYKTWARRRDPLLRAW